MELTINKRVFFDEITHTYVNEKNELLTGVTTLMKKMGVAPDYGDIPEKVLEYAAARGTATHQAIEAWCKGEPIDVDPAFEESAMENLAAFKTLGLHPLANEYLVSDNEHIATSIDIVDGVEEGVVDLVDTKTTALVHKVALAWQLSICKWLFERQNPCFRVRSLWCLHLRDGKARMIPVESLPESEVQELLRCFIEGRPYLQQKPVLTQEENEAVMSVESLERAIVALEAQIKEYKARQEQLKGGILDWMRKNNMPKWEFSEHLSFTRVEPSVKKVVDSARLKKEQPAIYEAYQKESHVKESLRINLK